MSIIAFDVDGTLVSYSDNKPRREVIDLLRILHKLGNRVIVWSGGGKEYSEMWIRRLNLQEFVDSCHTKPIRDARQSHFYEGVEEVLKKGAVDISVDDECVELGRVNIKV